MKLLEYWAFIESDFLREYDCDLSLELKTLSWRAFLVRLKGLSPNSALVAKLNSKQTIEDPEEAEAAVDRIW